MATAIRPRRVGEESRHGIDPDRGEGSRKKDRKRLRGIAAGVGITAAAAVVAAVLLVSGQSDGEREGRQDTTSVDEGADSDDGGGVDQGADQTSDSYLSGQEALLGDGLPEAVLPNSNDPEELLAQLYENRNNSFMYAPNVAASEAFADYWWFNNGGQDTEDPVYTADESGYENDGYRAFMEAFPNATIRADIEVLDHDVDPADQTAARHILAVVTQHIDDGNGETSARTNTILFTLQRREDSRINSSGEPTGESAVGFYVDDFEVVEGVDTLAAAFDAAA